MVYTKNVPPSQIFFTRILTIFDILRPCLKIVGFFFSTLKLRSRQVVFFFFQDSHKTHYSQQIESTDDENFPKPLLCATHVCLIFISEFIFLIWSSSDVIHQWKNEYVGCWITKRHCRDSCNGQKLPIVRNVNNKSVWTKSKMFPYWIAFFQQMTPVIRPRITLWNSSKFLKILFIKYVKC
jgi:hypothetical protein